MTAEKPRFERFLAGAARLATGSGLHPLMLLQAVEAEAERSVSDGKMANAYLVQLAPGDAGEVAGAIGQLSRAIVQMLEERLRAGGLQTVGPLTAEFAAFSAVPPGTVLVEAAFRLPSEASPQRGNLRPTQALKRQRNRSLFVEGTGRVPLRHTPFTVGRATDCDLVLLDFAVSRRHAVIEEASNGQLVIRDLGSRNKLVVEGAAADEVILDPGLHVTLGGTTLWLEEQQ